MKEITVSRIWVRVVLKKKSLLLCLSPWLEYHGVLNTMGHIPRPLCNPTLCHRTQPWALDKYLLDGYTHGKMYGDKDMFSRSGLIKIIAFFKKPWLHLDPFDSNLLSEAANVRISKNWKHTKNLKPHLRHNKLKIFVFVRSQDGPWGF